MIKKAKGANAVLLTTEKDYERINKNYKADIKYIKAKIIIEDQDRFINEIRKFV